VLTRSGCWRDVSEGNYPVRIESRDLAIATRPVGATPAILKPINILPIGSILNIYDSEENILSYADVYPGVDIVYISTARAVKEFIVLREPVCEAVFDFELFLEGLTPTVSEGTIESMI